MRVVLSLSLSLVCQIHSTPRERWRPSPSDAAYTRGFQSFTSGKHPARTTHPANSLRWVGFCATKESRDLNFPSCSLHFDLARSFTNVFICSIFSSVIGISICLSFRLSTCLFPSCKCDRGARARALVLDQTRGALNVTINPSATFTIQHIILRSQ